MPISRITGASIEDGSITLADLGITTIDSGTGNTLTLQANSRTGITIDVTGNTAIANTLTFSSTGARIRGDFNNATIANRVAFQTSTTNAATTLSLIPNGTNLTSSFSAESDSAATNGTFAQIGTVSNTDVRITSGIRGTGSYLPLTMFTGGSERLRIDTSGNVGIGTTTPDSFSRGYTRILGLSSTGSTALEINSATGSNAVIDMGVNGTRSFSITTDGTTPYLTSIGALPIGFAINGVERMRISSTGRLGIGTDAPSQLLHVAAGTILSSNTAGTIATVSIAGNGSTVGTSDFALQQGTSSEAYVFNRANSFLVLGTNNTERMRINASGSVSVGTATARGNLHSAASSFNPTSTNVWSVTAALTASGQFGGGLAFIDGSAGYGLWVQDAGGTFAIGQGSATGNLTERMRIDSSGRVLIGNPTSVSTNPRLQVIRSDATVGATNYQLAWFSNATGYANGLGIYAQDNVVSIGADFSGASAGAAALTFYTNSTTTPLNPTERMRITSGGELLVGTTSTIANSLLNVNGGINTVSGIIGWNNNDTFTLNGKTQPHYGFNLIPSASSAVGISGYFGISFATSGAERGQFDSSGNFKFNSGYGSVATAYGCRAWVNFNGTGTVAIRASGNVSSITDNGTGLYSVNFSNAMPDGNYSVSVACGGQWTGSFHSIGYVNDGVQDFGGWNPAAPTTTKFDLTFVNGNNGGQRADNQRIHVSVFR